MSNPVHSTLTTLIEAVAEAVILKTILRVIPTNYTSKENGPLFTHTRQSGKFSKNNAPFRIWALL